MWFYNMGIIWIYIGSIEVDFRYSWIKILEFIQTIPKFRQLWEKILKFHHCSKIIKTAAETFPQKKKNFSAKKEKTEWWQLCWWHRNIGDLNLMIWGSIHRCCWRVLVILYLLTLASGTNIQNLSLISKICHQHRQSLTLTGFRQPTIDISIKLPTSTFH